MTHVVVIGAGQAGGRAIEALRGNGFTGPITLIGAETHLPYERPPLSKEMLLDPASPKIDWVRPAAWYAEHNITLKLGQTATKLDRGTKTITLQDSTTISYDKLILATGTTPRKLAIPGGDHPRCICIRTLEDSEKLRPFMAQGSHIVVIGAGFIGLEAAAAARSHGANVTVLEMAPRPMGRGVPATIGELYAQLHRSKGVDLRLNTQISHIDGPDTEPQIHMADGTTLAATAIVVGIGVLPEQDLATQAGLETNNGIVVNTHAQTSDPDIYAAGDVTRHPNPLLGCDLRLESWQNAQNQAIAAAKNIAGIPTTYAEIPWFWSDQYGINMQITGLPSDTATEVTRGDLSTFQGLLFQLTGPKLTAAIGLNSPRDLRFAKNIIQAQIDVTPDELANPAVKLQDIAKRARPA